MSAPGMIALLRTRLEDFAAMPTHPRAAVRAWAIFSLLRAAERIHVERALWDDTFDFEAAQRDLGLLFHELGRIAAETSELDDVARLARGRLASTADVFYLREVAARRCGRGVTSPA